MPITVVFVNNAIYGMTGGQMAPTTLMGQKTATSPRGRDRGDGPAAQDGRADRAARRSVYVERVALFDAKQRVRAAKAIEKALRLQVENRGFSFVEVLAECPTHLGLTPEEAERWVKEKMVPVFPLGVKKDVSETAVGRVAVAGRSTRDAVLEAIGARERRRALRVRVPAAFGGEASGLKLAGAGGDGAQTAAMLMARAPPNEGFDATHIPSYGPESRGGTSYADVRIARSEVLSPDVPAPARARRVQRAEPREVRPRRPPGRRRRLPRPVVPAPLSEIAHALGEPRVKNMVALGALQAAAPLIPRRRSSP